MKSLRSVVVPNTPGIEVKKLDLPVPLSNFIAEVKSGRLQPAQTNTPARFSRSSGLVPARSVPSWRSTSYAAGDSRFFHSASGSLSGSALAATSAPSDSRVFQFFCRSSTFTAPFFAGFCPDAAAPKPARDSAVKPLNQLRRSIFITSVSPQYRPAFRVGIPAGVCTSRKNRAGLTMRHHERSRHLVGRRLAHAVRPRGRPACAARCGRALAACGAGDDGTAVRRETGPRRLGNGDPQPRLLEHRARSADRGGPRPDHPGVFHGARLLD